MIWRARNGSSGYEDATPECGTFGERSAGLGADIGG
jgi:hypothetical protein